MGPGLSILQTLRKAAAPVLASSTTKDLSTGLTQLELPMSRMSRSGPSDKLHEQRHRLVLHSFVTRSFGSICILIRVTFFDFDTKVILKVLLCTSLNLAM